MNDTTDTNLQFWEELYQSGHVQRYPWDKVVSFVYRNMPKDKPREEIRILEVGFGTGSNLWFAAREGFQVAGVEGSAAAVEYARKRLAAEGLSGDLRVGDFSDLPFEDNSFDLVIDRAALTCAGFEKQRAAIKEIQRVLRSGGRFHYNCYADSHSSYCSGSWDEEGRKTGITRGSLINAGAVYFASRSDIDRLFAQGWTLLSVKRIEIIEMLNEAGDIHAEWQVIAEKA